MWPGLLWGMLCFVMVHICVWFSTNLQFMNESIASKSLSIAIFLAVPITLFAYYGSRFTYGALEGSVWSVRFIGFGTSYLVFPILTWWLLRESMLTPKTLVCIGLSFLIICIQVFWK